MAFLQPMPAKHLEPIDSKKSKKNELITFIS